MATCFLAIRYVFLVELPQQWEPPRRRRSCWVNHFSSPRGGYFLGCVFCRISVDVRRGNIYIQYTDIHFLKNTVKRHQTNMYSYIYSITTDVLKNFCWNQNNIMLFPSVASRFHPLFVGSKCRMKPRHTRLQTTPGCYNISGAFRYFATPGGTDGSEKLGIQNHHLL